MPERVVIPADLAGRQSARLPRMRTRPGLVASLVLLGALATLTACKDGLDLDLRRSDRGFSTADAALDATLARPKPDARGIISYPGYQVAIARGGDSVATIASRLGLGVDELARYNGLKSGDTLRAGEVLALPRRVAESAAGAGAAGGVAAGGLAREPVDVEAIAGSAIDRSPASPTPAAAATAAGPEPVRHKVVRGETAYSIARLYGVSVRSLADWNGLGPDLGVREGQFLMIPVAAASAKPAAGEIVAEAPGAGSATPEPPSAKTPLPPEKAEPAKPADVPASPALDKAKTTTSRLAMPVQGKIIREFVKGKSNGIDIAAPAGTPVAAAADGTVAVVTNDTSNVTIVVVRHANNLLTVYAGMDAIKVAKGASVKRGQTLGVVRTGNPPFLHFEVAEGLDRVDPVPFLN